MTRGQRSLIDAPALCPMNPHRVPLDERFRPQRVLSRCTNHYATLRLGGCTKPAASSLPDWPRTSFNHSSWSGYDGESPHSGSLLQPAGLGLINETARTPGLSSSSSPPKSTFCMREQKCLEVPTMLGSFVHHLCGFFSSPMGQIDHSHQTWLVLCK